MQEKTISELLFSSALSGETESFLSVSADASAGVNAGKILSTTLWDQDGTVYVNVNGTQTALEGYTYNMYCPNVSASSTVKTLTGCSNTADSQILYYWIEKGANFKLQVTTDNYFYLETDTTGTEYYVSDKANCGEGTLSTINSALGSATKIGNGDFIAALNFYCGVNNHSSYGSGTGTSTGTSTTWYYGTYVDGTNAGAYEAAGFDSYSFISREMSGTKGGIYFGADGLTDVAYSVIRENLDYGELIRVGVPGHAIYMDGYRYNSRTSEYEYHLNYGWGTDSSGTNWYTVSQLSTRNTSELYAYVTYIIVDLSPDISVNVTSTEGDYYGGSFLRGIERINQIQKKKSTTFHFDDAVAGSVIVMSSSAAISSAVNVTFSNVNAAVMTTAGSLLTSSQGMKFQFSDGAMAVNSSSPSHVIRGTGSGAVEITLDSSYLYSGTYSAGAAALNQLLDTDSGYLYGEFDNSFYTSIKGYAVQSGTAADVITLTNGSGIFGGLSLGAGDNVLNLESGSLFCGSFAGSANTLTVNMTIKSQDYTGPMVVVKDSKSFNDFYSATGGVLEVTLKDIAIMPGIYNLVYGASARTLQNFTVNLTAPGIAETLSYSNPKYGNYLLTFNDDKLGLLYTPDAVSENRVNLYYGSYLINSWAATSSLTVSSGLRLDVQSGGTVSSITVKADGAMAVYDGGRANASTVSSEGNVQVYSGGTVAGMHVQGTLNVNDGASASDTTVDSGGTVVLAPGSWHSGTISIAADGTLNAQAGSRIYLDISSSGPSDSAKIQNISRVTGSPSYILCMDNAQAEGTYKLASGASGFSSTVTIQSEQEELGVISSNSTLYSNGFSCSLKVDSDGDLNFSVARTKTSSIIAHRGSVGYDRQYTETLYLKPDYAGRYDVYGKFGTLNGSFAIYNGSQLLGSGTISNGDMRFNGGNTVLLDSSQIYKIEVKNLDSGVSASSFSYTLEAVTLFWKATHDNDTPWGRTPITVKSADSTVLSSDWVGYSDPVDYQQFTLRADSRLSFTISANDTIRVSILDADMNTVQGLTFSSNGLMLSKTTDDKLYNAGSYYLKVESLNAAAGKNGADYSVSVDCTPVSPAADFIAASDINGNGISDILFQYTGGDNQIGFWMDGVSNWQGQGRSQPAEWQLMGAHDMNSDGNADVVMLGNVVVNGVPGAYVGFYEGGDTTRWSNINYLSNPANIQWNMAIGNLTGNANANSIVWHAPELGALGVWTDGTDNWVGLAAGFDSQWKMLGTGDFDGDGRAEVLFDYQGGLYTTDIDQHFVSLGGWGTAWEVQAIGDFSGCGRDDLILFNSESGSVVKFDGGKASEWTSLGQLDASDWFIVGAGDYTGDRRDDLLVRQLSTGMLGYYACGDFNQWVEVGRGVDMNWNVIA